MQWTELQGSWILVHWQWWWNCHLLMLCLLHWFGCSDSTMLSPCAWTRVNPEQTQLLTLAPCIPPFPVQQCPRCSAKWPQSNFYLSGNRWNLGWCWWWTWNSSILTHRRWEGATSTTTWMLTSGNWAWGAVPGMHTGLLPCLRGWLSAASCTCLSVCSGRCYQSIMKHLPELQPGNRSCSWRLLLETGCHNHSGGKSKGSEL